MKVSFTLPKWNTRLSESAHIDRAIIMKADTSIINFIFANLASQLNIIY